MTGADVFQVVASAVSIVDCSIRLTRFIKNLSDDARDIQEWLSEMKDSMDTLQNVLEFVKKVATGPNLKYLDNGPVEWICTIVRGAQDRAAKIYEKLPPIPDDGIFSKMESVLRKLMNDRVIKDHEAAIQRRTLTLQTLMMTLSLERTSQLTTVYGEGVPAPPYHDDDHEFETVRLKVNARATNSVSPTRETSLYDVSEAASIFTEATAPLPIIYRARLQELQEYQNRVTELESKRRLLEAATQQGTIVKLRRRLEKHMPLSAQDEALLVEKQADLLLRCHTVGRHLEAVKLLEDLIEDKEYMLNNETNGRIKLKMGELYIDQGRLGVTEKLKLAKNVLSDAETLLETLSPFPHALYLRSLKCLVRTLDMLRKPNDVRSLKSYVNKRLKDSNVTLDYQVNWEYEDEPECKALEWCRMQTSPSFTVESPTFKFDSIIQGTTALHLVVRQGRSEVLREMLVEVENIDVRDSDECTPLLIAAQERCSDTFKLLLDHGASLEEVDKLGQTVLHKCQSHSRDGRDIAIASIVQERAPVLINATESTGKTALWLACEESNEKMVEFLLDHDADPNIPSIKKKTPLQVAVDMRSSPSTRERHSNRLHIIEMLLRRASDPNQIDNLGNTPLYTAASSGDLKVVEVLLDPEYKTKVDLFGRHSQTPLAAAAAAQTP
ncbi:hypothetical protein NPX13_g436 [Xylaria arbuscula]|uniref:Fungal N-terminal domain-containing protein n=1 Tax=Xylaria arbuscula TaxID=114810 RepID=A0A9W8NPB0_9PEZI|nr:hypothetical protein NPX13_g436 [Xylaria arbuscula]